MPGLVPGIHVLFDTEIVDGRDKPGHDEKKRQRGDEQCLRLP